jgi:stage II sporulation protein P
MEPNRKRKILKKMKKGFCLFLLYGLLPLIFGGVVAALIFARSVGEAKTLALYSEVKNQSLPNLLGSTLQKKETQFGFYSPSAELLLPAPKGIFMMAGTSRYLFSINQKESEIPQEKNPPETVYEALPAGAKPIVRSDLSSPSFVINTTDYVVNVEEARSSAFPSATESASEAPLVLVLHTHATECYFEDRTNLSDFATEGVESYFLENQTSFRTSDPEKSVVKVGKTFAEELNGLGVPTLHCTTMHDQNDFNDAYINSAETVKQYLKEYPSIQYVIDLHRDSVVRGDSFVKSYTEIEGVASAQVMLVVGTNQKGRHPNWKQNLIVATSFKDSLDALYPSLSRALYLRTARFNQEYLPGCMLLEVGSAANTLEEAERAAQFAARAFFQMLKTEKETN